MGPGGSAVLVHVGDGEAVKVGGGTGVNVGVGDGLGVGAGERVAVAVAVAVAVFDGVRDGLGVLVGNGGRDVAVAGMEVGVGVRVGIESVGLAARVAPLDKVAATGAATAGTPHSARPGATSTRSKRTIALGVAPLLHERLVHGSFLRSLCICSSLDPGVLPFYSVTVTSRFSRTRSSSGL